MLNGQKLSGDSTTGDDSMLQEQPRRNAQPHHSLWVEESYYTVKSVKSLRIHWIWMDGCTYIATTIQDTFKAASSRLNGYSMCWFLSTLPAYDMWRCGGGGVFCERRLLWCVVIGICAASRSFLANVDFVWLWMDGGGAIVGTKEGRELLMEQSQNSTMRSIVGGSKLWMNERSDSFKNISSCNL